jgi:ribosomal-protein-alanine N-acetyltransferase
LTPPLATARLALEPLAPDHAPEALPGFSDPALYAYIPGQPRSEESALRAYFARLAAGSGNEDETWHNWIVFTRSPRECVGWVQATITDAREASIAYFVFARHQRNGYAREATGAMLDWLWTLPTLGVVTAQADVRNVASQRVVAALGFARDRDDVASDLRGEPTRDFVYRLAREPGAR